MCIHLFFFLFYVTAENQDGAHRTSIVNYAECSARRSNRRAARNIPPLPTLTYSLWALSAARLRSLCPSSSRRVYTWSSHSETGEPSLFTFLLLSFFSMRGRGERRSERMGAQVTGSVWWTERGCAGWGSGCCDKAARKCDLVQRVE